MSSKFLNVQDGDYKVTVREGGTITLDTGLEIGTVRITGDLVVDGQTTNILTENTVIEDQIIELNRGEIGAGVDDGTGRSGIQIDRGSLTDAFWLFDETVAWTDTQNPGTSDFGAWSPRDANGRILGLQTVSIVTPGTDLNLLGVYTGPGNEAVPNPGKLTVLGTTDYEDRVTDDDDIPNKKYVDDAIIQNLVRDIITEGTFPATATSIEVFDDSVTGSTSHAEIRIDGTVVADVYSDRVDLQDLRIQGSLIQTTPENQDIVLSAPGAGSIVIQDNYVVTKTPGVDSILVNPLAPTDGVKVYAKEESAGGTGLFFVNENDKRDEIISKNKSILYGIIF